MSDSISRQKAINVLNTMPSFLDPYGEEMISKHGAKIRLEFLKSAQPERKTGRWIEYLNEGLRWKCSKCSSRYDTPWHYCPNCGADMRGKQMGNDVIYRQDAIDALGAEPEVWINDDDYAMGANNQWHYDIDAIKAVPSAEPERKKGKWIKKMRVTETEKYISYDPDWYCACCGAKYDPHIAKIVNFCYVCGADMQEVNQSV